MKKLILTTLLGCLIATIVVAQAPQTFSYQTVVRDNNWQVMQNQSIGVQVAIIEDNASGTIVYEEEHTATTNDIGLINLAVGGGTVTQGTFANIDWGQHLHFMKISVDISGGSNFVQMGTTQLRSVPYALFAETANNPGPTGSQGIQGLPGDTGAVGPQGPIGLTGATGLQGATGPQGAAGNDGAAGATGPQGAAGNDGAPGPIGPPGNDGNDGTPGATGPAGNDGTDGVDGAVGATGPQGLPGDTGAVGPQGPIGLTGATGSQGVPGNDGIDGATGLTGAIGNTGAVGSQGPIGLTGNIGAVGPQGVPGNDGIDGATGPQGAAGNDGAAGATGLTGATGNTGAVGPQGPIGLTGNIGAVGPQGVPGNDGIDGATGLTGAIGNTGAVGSQGPIGLTGAIGNTGAVGPQGPIGLTGNIGAVGPQGVPGNDGIDGATGLTGAIGNTGAVGPQGPIGLTGNIGAVGATGPQGPIGLTGAAGATGPQGAAGNTGATGTFTGGTTIGEILFWNGTNWLALNPPINNNMFLTYDTTSNSPSWAVTTTNVVLTPVAAFTQSTDTIYEGATINFTDNSSNTPTTWAWSFGDGNTSTQQHPSNTYATAGVYTVTLTATNNAGSNMLTTSNSVVVEVNSPPVIGDFHDGGIIFYLDGAGGGLVCDIQDLGTAEWGCYGTNITGADGTQIGTGSQNTIDIVNANCSPNTSGNTIAANECANLSLNGYTDWFLPSKDELNQMYVNKAVIDVTALANGGSVFFGSYWSSSEYSGSSANAWEQNFDNGYQYSNYKSYSDNVRAVRAF